MTTQTEHTFRLVYVALLTEGHKTLAAEFLAASGMQLREDAPQSAAEGEALQPDPKGDAQTPSPNLSQGDTP
jgi:hypothetical protein